MHSPTGRLSCVFSVTAFVFPINFTSLGVLFILCCNWECCLFCIGIFYIIFLLNNMYVHESWENSCDRSHQVTCWTLGLQFPVAINMFFSPLGPSLLPIE